MSILTVELPDMPEIREGDEVTIRARMKGHRLVAATVRRLPVPDNGQTEEDRRAALSELFRLCDESSAADAKDESTRRQAAFDAFVREWSGAGKTPMTDAEIRAGYIAKQLTKHCK